MTLKYWENKGMEEFILVITVMLQEAILNYIMWMLFYIYPKYYHNNRILFILDVICITASPNNECMLGSE